MISNAFTAAGLVASLLVPPTAAANDWNTMPCTSGQLYPEQSIITQERSIIPGTVGCTSKEPEKGYKYAVASYYSGYSTGLTSDQMMLEYPTEPPKQSSPPSGNFYILEEPPYSTTGEPNPDAVCLVSDPHTRISCVRIQYDDKHLRVVTSLSVDDKIVQKDVKIRAPLGPNPNCATCRRQLLPGEPPPAPQKVTQTIAESVHAARTEPGLLSFARAGRGPSAR